MQCQQDNMEKNFSTAVRNMQSPLLAEFREVQKTERLQLKQILQEVISSQKDLLQQQAMSLVHRC